MPKNVCVVGAGVSGLSCGIVIAEHDHKVTIIANNEGDHTTSSIAAAFWYPFAPGKIPDHSWYKHEWAIRSYQVFESLLGVPNNGISEVELYEYFSNDNTDDEVQEIIRTMWWRKHKDLPNVGFDYVGEEKYAEKHAHGLALKTGIHFRTFVITMSDYLKYLRQRNEEIGVSFRPGIVNSLTSLLKEYDVVVNCTGMGSRELVPEDKDPYTGEHNLRPVEGVVIALKPLKSVTDITLIHSDDYFGNFPLYIVPRGGLEPDIILGGSTSSEIEFDEPERKQYKPQHLSWASLSADHWTGDDTQRIISDCYEFEPELETSHPPNLVKVGYRPKREPEVRLGKEGSIIHNYGHGGAGVTLSWGCAEDVLSLVELPGDIIIPATTKSA